MDLRSSSVTGDEEGGKTSAIKDIDKSSGESREINKNKSYSLVGGWFLFKPFYKYVHFENMNKKHNKI